MTPVRRRQAQAAAPGRMVLAVYAAGAVRTGQW